MQEYASGSDRIHFSGFQPQSEIGKMYVAADMFCHPSASETWGLVVNEAMCFGLPLVVSDAVGSAADLVRPEWNGLLFKRDDVGDLTAKLRQMLNDETLRVTCAANSRRLVGAFTFERSAEAVIEALDTVVTRT
jgi:glycosyltransferase involved in cell wall biosynthesis